MPVCNIIISSEKIVLSNEQQLKIREIVSKNLNSKAHYLDLNHIVLRIFYANKEHMLAEIECELFAQFYLRRFFDRDYRASKISTEIGKLLDKSCATWINLMFVGYSRFTIDGQLHFSSRNESKEINKLSKEK